jgi:hypothetical protein
VEPNSNPGLVEAVSILQWPEEDRLRRQLAAVGLPRLLLVAVDGHPPELLDELEDWARVSSDPSDSRARAEVLQRRGRAAGVGRTVRIDDDGLLWVGSAWVALPDSQLPIARVLRANLERVVRFDALEAACHQAGFSADPTVMRTRLARLRVRVRDVGLDLVNVRRRGVLLSARGEQRRPS